MKTWRNGKWFSDLESANWCHSSSAFVISTDSGMLLANVMHKHHDRRQWKSGGSMSLEKWLFCWEWPAPFHQNVATRLCGRRLQCVGLDLEPLFEGCLNLVMVRPFFWTPRDEVTVALCFVYLHCNCSDNGLTVFTTSEDWFAKHEQFQHRKWMEIQYG